MGAPGSGRPPDPNSERGRQRGQSGAVGTGEPTLPVCDLSPEILKEWNNLVDLTMGVSYEQDSESMLQLARLIVRHRKVEALLEEDPSNDKLNATALSIGRQKIALYRLFGLTPRDRQAIMVPKKEEDKPKSRFEQIRESNAEYITRAVE